MPKLVVFDVDGTLVDFEGRTRPRARASVARLCAAGIPVAIATGRPIAVADFTLDQVGGGDYVVGGNGAVLRELSTGQVLREASLPSDVVEATVTAVRSALPGVGFSVDTLTAVVEEPGFARRLPPSPHRPPIEDVLVAAADELAHIHRLTVFHDDYDHRLDDLAALVAPFIDERCEVQVGTILKFIEIVPRGLHKAVALVELVQHLGIDAADVLAFGDGSNDSEMLEWAGTGVAMGSARDELKAIADVVIASVEEDGVADYLEPLLDTARI